MPGRYWDFTSKVKQRLLHLALPTLKKEGRRFGAPPLKILLWSTYWLTQKAGSFQCNPGQKGAVCSLATWARQSGRLCEVGGVWGSRRCHVEFIAKAHGKNHKQVPGVLNRGPIIYSRDVYDFQEIAHDL